MKSFGLIVMLAGVWALTGAAVGLGLNSLYNGEWIFPCGALNMIIGLLMLLGVIQSESLHRLFYEGPKDEEDRSVMIALLWALPFSLLLVGLAWWLLGKVMPP